MQSKTSRLPLAHLSISGNAGGFVGRVRSPSVLADDRVMQGDEIDAICSSVSNLQYISLASLETYTRRMTTCSTSDGILINMVVGGEVVTLESIEGSSGLVIAEMPVNISEIL